MDMDMSIGIEEQQLMGLCHNNNNTNHVAKGKRTKRQRPLSPCTVAATAVTSSCSSANSGGGGGGDHGSFSSPTTPFESTGKEEEEMANCLILLAQGKREGNDGGGGNPKKITYTAIAATTTNITTVTTITTATATKNGFYNYECKTCNKTFPSFQALGGHRAGHKKPKMNLEEKKGSLPPLPSSLSLLSPPIIFEFEEAKQTNIKSSSQIPMSLQLGCGNNRPFHGNKSKIHECSICGAEFTSGQALGGHMRKHRTSTNAITNTSTHVVVNMSGSETSFEASAAATTTTATVEVKTCNVLEIDLNLPAPEEDIRDSNFQFTATSKSMVLPAAPALVGCHY